MVGERPLRRRLARGHDEAGRRKPADVAPLGRDPKIGEPEPGDAPPAGPSNGAPRSSSAPTVMSPLMPEKASKKACMAGS